MKPIPILAIALLALCIIHIRDSRKRSKWSLKYRYNGESVAASRDATETAWGKRDAIELLARRLDRDQPGRIVIISNVEQTNERR